MSEKKPMILVIAGPNGSGKTTVSQFIDKVGTYTNADEIVAATGIDNLEAAKIADERRYESIRRREDFTFETVLSSNYKMEILRTAKAEGYFIKCFFILTKDPEINQSRVRGRVANGGHGVEPEKITERYYKSLGNIKELMQLCDILHIYDNSEAPKRIVRKHKEDISVYADEYWSEEKLFELIGKIE